MQVVQGSPDTGLGFQVAKGDDAGEFVAEGDVDEIPLGVFLGGFFVVVGVGGI